MTKIILALLLSPCFALANEASEGVPPEKSLQWLKNGNTRYTKHKLRNDGQGTEDIAKLSKGQKPHAIVLSCSDSRVPPELIFDQKLGEIFVVRTAGESLGDNAVGSIEYAIEHLGSKLIVVMGHTSCGAVKAAHGSFDGKSLGSPALDALVRDIHPRISSFKGKNPSKQFADESWANAEGVAQDLSKRSKIISEKIAQGQVKVVPSLYDLETGKVTFRDEVGVVPVREAASENSHTEESNPSSSASDHHH